MVVGAEILAMVSPQAALVSLGDGIGSGSGGAGMGWVRMLVGAFALVFGARIGGGCTSGHGITGMAGMSLSSFIDTAAIFGGALGTTLLMR